MSHSHVEAEALEALARFPLLQALFGRRSRRFGVGMEIPGGPLAHTSRHPPEPLSALERAVLIACGAGVTGLNFGIPYAEGMPEGAASDYTLRPVGRANPSGAAAHACELLVLDDSGSYITDLRRTLPEASALYRGPQDLPRVLGHVDAGLRRLGDRVQVPYSYPHVSAHNRWVVNRPGSTVFLPIVDQVDALLNHLWIRTSEGSPLLLAPGGRMLGNPAPLIEAGVLHADRAITLASAEAAMRTSTVAEMAMVVQNIQLALQAMGLGGWPFTGLNAHSVLGAYAGQGLPGLGFRFEPDRATGIPNPIGLDGVFETRLPPYVPDIGHGVEAFLAGKFAPGPASPFRHDGVRPGDPCARHPAYGDYFRSLIADIHATHGRFPVSQPSIGTALATQAHHIDLDFYDRHLGPGAYLDTHARHAETWHPRPETTP